MEERLESSWMRPVLDMKTLKNSISSPSVLVFILIFNFRVDCTGFILNYNPFNMNVFYIS